MEALDDIKSNSLPLLVDAGIDSSSAKNLAVGLPVDIQGSKSFEKRSWISLIQLLNVVTMRM